MRLPKAIRLARSLSYSYQNPTSSLDSFNRGFYNDPNANLPDSLRGSGRLNMTLAESQASIDSIANAGRPRLPR
jgi:hypothetical protein